MGTFVTIIHVMVSIFLIITVLLQAGKGASIGSSFGGSGSSQALFGAAGPTTFLAKITVACAVIFMLTSLYTTYVGSRKDTGSVMRNAPTVQTEPAKEATAPQPLRP
ncbi:MAG: preprotein translocase subunit SecG [Deltaproteobacteria bacterium]|nr:preprotein translocase subunit SecG [Deltaproteobacteria bacterium]